MKNGFFSTIGSKLPLLMALLCLQGCASFLQLGESVDDPADFDRGYERDTASVSEDEESNTEASVDSFDVDHSLNYEQKRIKRAIHTRDVVLGMTRHEVLESWGQPAQREVAGRGPLFAPLFEKCDFVGFFRQLGFQRGQLRL